MNKKLKQFLFEKLQRRKENTHPSRKTLIFIKNNVYVHEIYDTK